VKLQKYPEIHYIFPFLLSELIKTQILNEKSLLTVEMKAAYMIPTEVTIKTEWDRFFNTITGCKPLDEYA